MQRMNDLMQSKSILESELERMTKIQLYNSRNNLDANKKVLNTVSSKE